ncbi:MAG: 4Fe-4S dicluster domain-containing protein [SAR324 cluster bacterium]|nr:4Fe-4S dicluster domain-containing protein [SAR324 cluster bacterium]
MKKERRDFIKQAGFVGAAVVTGGAAVVTSGILAPTTANASSGHEVTDSDQPRLGMVIDMTKCKEECNDCSDICHSVHNVPDHGNPKDEIKWIWKNEYERVFTDKSHQYVSQDLKQKPFLTMCNHCDDPPCVKVCPTNATFKRNDGIVQMDFHRCIGCRFCMAGCPYGSRSFNWIEPRPAIKEIDSSFPTRERGVVEKCNFCAELIDKGEKPACVTTCKEGALIFGDLNDPNSEIRKVLETTKTIQRKPGLGTKPSVFYVV